MKRFALLLLAALPATALADDAVIEAVGARQSGDGWTFKVTVRHAETGWDDYADGWRVVLEDGTELGMRVLHHPHVNEQPFTRSLNGVAIPDGVDVVYIETRTNADGWSKARARVSLK